METFNTYMLCSSSTGSLFMPTSNYLINLMSLRCFLLLSNSQVYIASECIPLFSNGKTRYNLVNFYLAKSATGRREKGIN